MKKDTEFHSALAPRMREFVDFKRMQGYDYTDQARTLGYFDRFLVEEPGWSHDSALALETLRRYVDTTEGLKPFTRSTRISSVREFSRHLHARNQHSAVLPRDVLPRVRRTERFFLITPGQVADLMGAAATVLPGDGIRARTVSLLIGVLYSTGLRHNYACRRLALWREAGLDIEALLPVLATAMGHVNILATQRYLHIDAIGLLDASEKFNTYSTNPREQSK